MKNVSRPDLFWVLSGLRQGLAIAGEVSLQEPAFTWFIQSWRMSHHKHTLNFAQFPVQTSFFRRVGFGILITFSLWITEQLSWAGLALITKPSLGSTRKTGNLGSSSLSLALSTFLDLSLSNSLNLSLSSEWRRIEGGVGTELGWADAAGKKSDNRHLD